MTDQERNQVLKMIEDGKITPEEGLTLMQALDQEPVEDLPVAEAPTPVGTVPTSEPQVVINKLEPDPNIESVKDKVRRYWQIPLWIGVAITLLSAFGMFAILQSAGTNFLFYFMLLPLLLGVAVTAIGTGSRRARWLFVDVHQSEGAQPKRIFLGFPLPLGLTAWFLRTFGPLIPDLRRTNVDEIIQVIESGFDGTEPLVVNVTDGSDGERVQVYIG